MKKIYEKELGFQLYKNRNEYILSVLTGSHAMRTFETRLTEEEEKHYENEGIAYIDKLAGELSRFPGNYASRRLSKDHVFYKQAQKDVKPKLMNDLFDVFNNYEYNNPTSNASSLDKYLRALCKCMIDHSKEEVSFELIRTIFIETEHYELIAYDAEWEQLLPIDIDEYPEKTTTFETAIHTIKGLIGENKNRMKDFLRRNKAQANQQGSTYIPFDQYLGNFAQWHNSSPASIFGCLEDYVFGSKGMKDNPIEFDESEVGWDLFPDFLITGMMYE